MNNNWLNTRLNSFVNETYTQKSIQILKNINKLGFVTISSQEGNETEDENPIILYGPNKGKPIINENGSKATFLKTSERAYCDGFILISKAKTFIKNLKNQKQTIRIITHPNKEYINLTKESITYEDGTEEESYPTNVPIVENKNEIEEYIDMITNSGYHKGSKSNKNQVNLKYWCFLSIVDMEYGYNAINKDGLFSCIDKALKGNKSTNKNYKCKTRKNKCVIS